MTDGDARPGFGFSLVWAGRSLSLLGEYVQFLALPLWVQHVTGSPSAGILVFAIFYLPQIFCTPFAGVLADRFDRRHLVIVIDVAAFVVASSMALTIQEDRLGLVYLHICALQVLAALGVPAFMSLLPDMVGPKKLMAANAMLNMSAGVAITVGPLVGVAMLTNLSITAVIWVNALTYLVGAVCMWSKVPGSRPSGGTSGVRGGIWAEMRQGFVVLHADPVLRPTVAAEAAWLVCFGAAVQLTLMHLGTEMAGAAALLGVGSGVASLLMTTLLARTRRDLPPERLFLGAVVATAPIGVLVVLLTGASGLVVVAGLVLGVQSYLVIIAPMLHCQRRADPGVRGRVIAVRRTSRATAQVVGLAVSALLTQWVAPLVLVAAGGVLATVTATRWAWNAERSSGTPVPAAVSGPAAPVSEEGAR